MDSLEARELLFKKMNGKASVHSVVVREAISLLNEQQKEIKRLESKLEEMTTTVQKGELLAMFETLIYKDYKISLKLHENEACVNYVVFKGDEDFISGTIKWDGCSDNNIGYKHFCGLSDIIDFNKLLSIIHAESSKLIDENEIEEYILKDLND